jgi:hypothetical protein
MEFGKKIKIALDETRMLILGAQILLGFQFRSAFQDGFDSLPAHSRYLDAAALGFMVLAVGLMIAPGPYHRIVEEGNDSGRLHRVISRFAELALLPFAFGLGLDIAVIAERIFGRGAGFVAGVGAALLALLFWYVLPQLRKELIGGKERAKTMQQLNKRQQTPLTQKIEQMLTEARVILPGAQAMLGFQLAIVLTNAFEKLPSELQLAHAVSLGLISLAVILLMTPAAYHRIVFQGEDAPDMHRVGSMLVTAATVPLALGLAGDVYVVITKIAGDSIGLIGAALALLALAGLWYGLPLAARCHGAGTAASRYSASPAE